MKTITLNKIIKYTFLILCIFAFQISTTFAQSPEKMSYQAVVRDANNDLVVNQNVGMQISILQTNVTGTEVYKETHTPTSNDNGLVSFQIGDGSVISGNFSTIDWEGGPYFIKVETDPTGGTNYSISGTSQLLSVPYAMHAESINNIKTNTSIADVEISNDGSDGYALLHIRPTLATTNDSSAIFFGEGSIEQNGMRIVYDGIANEMKITGHTFTSDEGVALRIKRTSGKTIFTKGIEIDETTSSPGPNRVYGNSSPIAYGYISSATVATDYGITSVTNTTTGLFVITLDNSFSGPPVVMVTSFNNTLDTEIATYSFSSPNIIQVRIVNENNTAVNSNFSFVVFGTPL